MMTPGFHIHPSVQRMSPETFEPRMEASLSDHGRGWVSVIDSARSDT